MTIELTYLAWTLVLALVYIGLPSQLRRPHSIVGSDGASQSVSRDWIICANKR